jgi:hypothetical protein
MFKQCCNHAAIGRIGILGIAMFILVSRYGSADEAVLDVNATVVRTATHPVLLGYDLVVVRLTNPSQFHKDIVSIGSKHKTGHEVFEPIWVEWLESGKVVAKDAVALQRSITLNAEDSVELCLLLKRPKDGNYTLKIFRKALMETANDVSPAGFSGESRVAVTDGVLSVISRK